MSGSRLSNSRIFLSIYLFIVAVLGFMMLAVVCVMLAGLFDPIVDNKEIFAVIGPAFQMVTGAFIGIVSSRFGKTKDGE